MPEREGDLYCTRSYVFAGTFGYVVRNLSTERVVKARGIVSREEVGVPDRIVEMRAELGFDYGKFDYNSRHIPAKMSEPAPPLTATRWWTARSICST